jgi:hypothetical protein
MQTGQTTMTVEVEEIDSAIFDVRAIAKQIVTDAVANLNEARQRDREEWLADQAAMEQLEHSAACRRGWANRKARIAGATSPAAAPEDVE